VNSESSPSNRCLVSAAAASCLALVPARTGLSESRDGELGDPFLTQLGSSFRLRSRGLGGKADLTSTGSPRGRLFQGPDHPHDTMETRISPAPGPIGWRRTVAAVRTRGHVSIDLTDPVSGHL